LVYLFVLGVLRETLILFFLFSLFFFYKKSTFLDRLYQMKKEDYRKIF